MRYPTVFILFAALVVLGGCLRSQEESNSRAPDELLNFDGPSDALSWRLEDKREISTPCTIGGTPLASFNLPLDTVEILNAYEYDGYLVILARWTGSDVCRFVRLRAIAGGGFLGYEAEILSGQVLHYGMHVKYDMANFSTMWLKEYTIDDELTIAIQDLDGEGIAESYSLNSADQVTFQRDIDPFADNLTTLEAQIASIPGATLEGITGFGNSLYDNVEGSRLVSLLESHDFAQWLYNRAYTGDLVVSASRWTMSDWLTGCTAVKCLFGGLANPVCATCTVVTGGLWFTKAVVCVLGHCDDLPPWW